MKHPLDSAIEAVANVLRQIELAGVPSITLEQMFDLSGAYKDLKNYRERTSVRGAKHYREISKCECVVMVGNDIYIGNTDTGTLEKINPCASDEVSVYVQQ